VVVHFRAEHHFDASPAEVAAALLDARFYEALELPDVGPAELVAVGSADTAGNPHVDGRAGPVGTGAARAIVVRYEYTGGLDPLARGLLRGSRLTWTQTLRLGATGPDESSFVGSLEIDTESSPSLLRARAVVHLEPSDASPPGGSRTRRLIDGELVVSLAGVSLPGIGRMAERRIVPGVLRRLDVEAATLGRLLR
jgi:hypothetical protein